jgi:hypothetical protein
VPRDVELIEGKFIVKFKEPKEGEFSAQNFDKSLTDIVDHADFLYDNVNGFASSLTEEEIETLRSDPNVSVLGKEQLKELQRY